MDILDLKSKDPAKRAKAEANIKATKDAVLKEYQMGGGGGGSMSPQDKQALEWANSNPNDPRSAQIKQKLGV